VSVSGLAQTIDSLDNTTLAKAGRLIIRGSGFGGAQGEVLIDGVSAPISFWSDSKVRAYVPDASGTGVVDVVVVTSGGDASNPAQLEVRERTPQFERLRWTFTADAQTIISRPAVAPDGTVYFTDISGHLYALEPDGGVKWIRVGAGNSPTAIGPDGTIYVNGGGGGALVTAYSPSGDVLWRYIRGGAMINGPSVGPDGNIYGCTDDARIPSGPGAFVLSPDGQELFTHQGDFNVRSVPKAWEIGFTDTQFFVTSGMGGPVEGVSGIFAFDLGGGGPNWDRSGQRTPFGAGSDVYVNDTNSSRIAAYRADGSEKWAVGFHELPGIGGASNIAGGSDGTVYVPIGFWLHALKPADGSIRWSSPSASQYLYPVVRPDNRFVTVAEFESLQPTKIVALDAQTGDRLWEQSIGPLPEWYGAFSPDGRTVYYGAVGSIGEDPACTFYAIDATLDDEQCPADMDGSGVLDGDDFFFFLDLFASGDARADLTGNGVIDVNDFFAFLDLFAQGC